MEDGPLSILFVSIEKMVHLLLYGIVFAIKKKKKMLELQTLFLGVVKVVVVCRKNVREKQQKIFLECDSGC